MSDLDRVLGRSVPLRETTTTGDVAPVMTGGGMNGRPKRPGLAKKEDEKRRRRTIASVLGATMEAAEEDDYEETTEKQTGVIPANAEELEDGRSDPSGLRLKKPEFKQSNPDSPKDSREALMSPKAALVAPDVTPDSMTEIDPSEVPGGEGETFKAPDVSTAPPEAGPVPADIGAPMPAEPGQDTFTTAMDTLLGKSRKPSAPGRAQAAPASAAPPPPAMESAPAISPETAAAMFAAPVEGVSGDALLRQNQPMPDPTVGDGKRVFESYRRFL
jgi:hypothetical protein